MSKIALVTGANKGIGFETARQLAKRNFTVLLAARNKDRGNSAVEKLKQEGLNVLFLELNPCAQDSISQAVEEVQSKFGVLDVLINNAGLFLPTDGANPIDVSTDILRQTYEINVFGLHSVTRGFWPLLNQSKAARLVNVSSALGSMGLHSSGSFGDFKVLAYDSSKAAVNMLTTHYAYQWKASAHKANCVHPGSVKTDMNPNGDLSLEEGAKTSVALATIGEDGPNGKFFHLGDELPW